MIISYYGEKYSGWQRQKSANSIQEEIESAIKIITKENVECVASGRTDAKVNAYCQPVHFDIKKTLDERKFLHSINGILPEDIKVLSVVQTNIHARFSAKRKTYLYKMYVSSIELPLCRDALQISPNINIKDMKKFLKLLIGEHDFSGFRASGSSTESSVRKIYKAKLKREGIYLNLYITGNGFLYKMVRNIVGTMLKVGEKKIDLTKLKNTIFTTYKSTYTVKPEYLYLLDVKYEK